MKKFVSLLSFFAGVSCLFGQITITQFNAAPDFEALTWTGNTSTSSGALSVVGGDGTGSVFYDISSLGLMGNVLDDVQVFARIESGNFASGNGFTVNFFDGGLNGVLTASFNSSSFTTGPGFTSAIATLTLYVGAITDTVPIAYLQIAGDGSQNAFRFSFDQIVANASVIPEPSTYAAIFGALALAFVAYRRRQKAA